MELSQNTAQQFFLFFQIPLVGGHFRVMDLSPQGAPVGCEDVEEQVTLFGGNFQIQPHAKSPVVVFHRSLGRSASKIKLGSGDEFCNRLMADAHRRKFDAVLVWKLDRFARSLKQLVNAPAEMDALGVAFVSLRDNLDLSTPSGRLMFQIIGAMAEFERALIQERVRAGLRHARHKESGWAGLALTSR
jgi:hypothetical protein